MFSYKFPELNDKEWLYQKYAVEGLNIYQIADIIGGCNQLVHRFLRSHNIYTRNHSEAFLKKQKIKIIDNPEVINGLMLGDGCINNDRGKTINAHLMVAQKQYELTDYIRSLVCPDAQIKKASRKALKNGESNFIYCFSTPYNPIITNYYKKWYPNHKKIVPLDLILSPTTVLHWWLGDGTTSKNECYVKFCTNGFMKQEVDFLNELLKKELGFYFNLNKEHLRKDGNMAYVLRVGRRKDVELFFDYIGPSPVECMRYRWKWAKNNLIINK